MVSVGKEAQRGSLMASHIEDCTWIRTPAHAEIIAITSPLSSLAVF